jgi:hypothetical protein
MIAGLEMSMLQGRQDRGRLGLCCFVSIWERRKVDGEQAY